MAEAVSPAAVFEADPTVAAALAPGWSPEIARRVLELSGAVALGAHGGFMLFLPCGADTWEAHYAMPAPIRGKAALRCARECLDTMFTRYGAGVIFGRTPRDNRAARLMNQLLGARSVDEGLFTGGGRFIRYRLERTRWAKFSAA